VVTPIAGVAVSEAARLALDATGLALSEEDRDMAEEIIEAIGEPERADPDGWLQEWRASSGWSGEIPWEYRRRKLDGELPRLDLPGFGSRREDCGAEIPHFCEDCGHVFTIGRTCAQSRCPRCAPQWVIERAIPKLTRIHEAAKMKSASLDEPVFKHHVVISPPPGDWYLEAEDPLDETFHVIGDILKAADAEGAVGYHPWTGDNDGEGFEQHHRDDRGRWKGRLFNDRDWKGDVREELKHRPHFHAVVAAPWIPGGDVTKAVYEATGWIIHRITERNGSARSLSDLESVARALTYSISHAGIDTDGERNQSAIRAYGSAYHAAECRPENREAASEAVRGVASDTLGVSIGETACNEKVPEEESSDLASPSVPDSAGDGDGGAGSIEADDDLGGDREHNTRLKKCGGGIEDIDKAPEFLEREEWRQQARHVDQLQTTWEEWERLNGWRAWIEEGPPPD
jgi:hypothetical protein